jgi:hypothetical protein
MLAIDILISILWNLWNCYKIIILELRVKNSKLVNKLITPYYIKLKCDLKI